MIFAYRTCESWTQARARDATGQIPSSLARTFNETWLLGFMSGVNSATNSAFEDDPLQKMDSDIFFDWMDKYCALYPKQLVSNGGIKLFVKLVDLTKKQSPQKELKPDVPKGVAPKQ